MIISSEQIKPEEARSVEKGSSEVSVEVEKMPETQKALSTLGEETAREVENTSRKTITSGTEQIERAVSSIGGGPEDTEEGQAVIADVQGEIADLNSEIQDKINQLTRELISKETDPEKQEKVAEKAQKVIEKIVNWAEEYGINISRIKKLGGGFVNLVLLIETPEGVGYVAKAFTKKRKRKHKNTHKNEWTK